MRHRGFPARAQKTQRRRETVTNSFLGRRSRRPRLRVRANLRPGRATKHHPSRAVWKIASRRREVPRRIRRAERLALQRLVRQRAQKTVRGLQHEIVGRDGTDRYLLLGVRVRPRGPRGFRARPTSRRRFGVGGGGSPRASHAATSSRSRRTISLSRSLVGTMGGRLAARARRSALRSRSAAGTKGTPRRMALLKSKPQSARNAMDDAWQLNTASVPLPASGKSQKS